DGGTAKRIRSGGGWSQLSLDVCASMPRAWKGFTRPLRGWELIRQISCQNHFRIKMSDDIHSPFIEVHGIDEKGVTIDDQVRKQYACIHIVDLGAGVSILIGKRLEPQGRSGHEPF